MLVRGGLPRTYYIGLGEPRDGRFPAVCLVPRGAEEGSTVEIDNDALQLVANRPVSFRLYSSLTRTEDALGQVVEFTPDQLVNEELHMHAPLNAVIRFGKRTGEQRLIPVKLGARLTEIGTLEIWAESKVSEPVPSELGVPAEEIRKYFDGVRNFRLDLGEESEQDFYMRMIKELGLSVDEKKPQE